MDWPETCAGVTTRFNEGKTVAPLVSEVRSHLPTVIVVDDVSTAQTAMLADGTDAQVHKHPQNLGKGAARKMGLATASTQGFAWAFTRDGDGQRQPEDIPWLRRVVNRWMSRRISECAGRFLPDSQCGFRLVNLKAWAGLRLETDRFESESEMLLAFVRAGYQVEFVPIHVIGSGPRSRIHPLKDTWRWLQWWKRNR